MPSLCGASENAAPELDEDVELVEVLLADEALERLELLALAPEDAPGPVHTRTMTA
jgi:hypothetical protein